jgi:hypothetical protein
MTKISIFVMRDAVVRPHPASRRAGRVIAIGMGIVFAHMTWIINLSALVVDVIPQRSLPTTFRVIAAGSALGSIGHELGCQSPRNSLHIYGPAFLVMAGFSPLALLWYGACVAEFEQGGEASATAWATRTLVIRLHWAPRTVKRKYADPSRHIST